MVSKEERLHHKCMVPQVPRATIGVINRNRNGDLHVRGMLQDESFFKYENIGLPRYKDISYRITGKGDSGGPVMKTIIDKSGVKRLVQVAVISGGSIIGIPDIESKCFDQVTKLTEEVVEWLKELEKGNYYTGKTNMP